MTSEEREEAREHADDTAIYFVCHHCGKEATVVRRDFGIGRYEYQGARGIHRDERECCSECGEEL
jgi:hypothetical protein